MPRRSSYIPIGSSTYSSVPLSSFKSIVSYYSLLALRKLRLQILRQLTPLRLERETKKVVVYLSRKVVVIHVLHLALPVTTTIALIVININRTFVGHVSQTSITALQFVAKALEILMQASLATVTLAIVRAQLLSSNPLPIGGIVAPYRSNDVSFLFSLQLWGCITSTKTMSTKRVFTWLLLVPLIVIMATLVGPSSAVLLIPRPMDYQNSKLLFLMDPAETVFPRSTSGLVSESFASSVTLNRAFFSRSSKFIPSVDDIDNRFLSTYSRLQDNKPVDSVSLPSKWIEYIAVMAMVEKGDETSSVTFDARQPVVEWTYESADGESFDELQDTSCAVALDNFKPNVIQNGTDDGFASMTKSLPPTYNQYMGPDSKLRFYATYGWQKGCSKDTVYLARVIWRELSNGSFDVSDSMILNVTASWRIAKMNLTIIGGSPYLSSQLDPKKSEENLPIRLSPSWMMQGSSEFFEHLVERDDDSLTPIYGGLLIVLFGLSSLPQWTLKVSFADLPHAWSMGMDCVEDSGSLSPSQCTIMNSSTNQFAHGYNNVLAYTTTNWTNPTTLTRTEIQRFISGYGYNSDTTPVQLSLAVLCAYVILLLCHILYCFITGLSATSWDSTADLLMLALNSHRPPRLEATSAGVDTLATFREPVSLRANDQDTVEIVFTNDVDMKGIVYRRIKPNFKY